MSPERIGGESYGYVSDIWSFGLSILTCALGEYPLSTEGGYWGLLHSLKEDAPPTVPEDRRDEFSDEFHDFIEKCLMRDPKERWSATDLLAHPFLADCAEQMENADDGMDQEGSETARDELAELIDVLVEHKIELAKAAMLARFKDRGDTDVPRVAPYDDSKLKALGKQLGLPFSRISNMFASRWRVISEALDAVAERLEGGDGSEGTEIYEGKT